MALRPLPARAWITLLPSTLVVSTAIAIASTSAGCGGSDSTVPDSPMDAASDTATSSPDTSIPEDAIAPVDASPDAAVAAKRLRLVDERVLDEKGAPIRLRGANLEGVTPAEADELSGTLHMNLARLRISFEGTNRDDADPSGFSAAYRAQLDGWVDALTSRGIWTVLEMRADDALTNDKSLYETTGAGFVAYRRAWVYLASRYKTRDYIAGYGLLAEPSVNKSGLANPVDVLVKFQGALMDAITNDAGDSSTPFFIGPDFNYDTMQYRYDAYYEAHAARRGRLFYAVNMLMPKPWIQDGTDPAGAQVTYPVLPEATNFDSLLEVKAGENYQVPAELERVFNKRREEPEGFAKLMSSSFAPWYLGFATKFRAKHHVPFYVDQFGAPVGAGGQLAYEKDLVRYFEKNDLHWTRWSYNAGSPPRKIAGNSAVIDFYRKLDFTKDGGL